ncbi:hypothetical protein HKCCE2091_19750 [Rhodobacterales bacterium HKCCE2091]|nr:hypothetical protein [Rhodobacterales bacterium HKCCE2091]
MKPLIVAAALAVAAPASAATELLVNGSFEMDPGVAGSRGGSFAAMPTTGRSWDTWDSLPGWNGGGTGIDVYTDRTFDRIDTQDGEYYVELDTSNNSSMTQDVALTRGGYRLSFYFSPRTRNPATNGIEALVEALGSQLASVQLVGSNAPGAAGDWTRITLDFYLAQAANVTIGFYAQGRGDGIGGLIDNASLTQIPLPATGAMAMLALGGLAATRRRKKGA